LWASALPVRGGGRAAQLAALGSRRWEGPVIEISQITGTKDADIEDLFDRDLYLKLLSLAYNKELPTPLTAADINAADPRVVRAVETYFAQNNIAGGKFDHYRPAAILLRQQATLLPQIGQDTINRGAQLLQRINALLT
jgi:hypothetical protein